MKHEHQVILLVLRAAEREREFIARTGRIHGENIEKMVDFFRNFADRCHHAKEERHLFARMEGRGMSRDSGPIAVMLMEHEEGRRRIAAIAEALPRASKNEPSAIAGVKENPLSCARLLRAHIDKEDNVLYPTADNLLSQDDRKALDEESEKSRPKRWARAFMRDTTDLPRSWAKPHAPNPNKGLGRVCETIVIQMVRQ